jgi:hypothetical protein
MKMNLESKVSRLEKCAPVLNMRIAPTGDEIARAENELAQWREENGFKQLEADTQNSLDEFSRRRLQRLLSD